jgi:hypothetical protein
VGLKRLNANGSLDTSFNAGTGANGSIRTIALQSDGKVLIGGEFIAINGVVRPYVARLFGDSIAPLLNLTQTGSNVILTWPVSTVSFQLQQNTNVALPNAWWHVPQPAVTNGNQVSITTPTVAA